MSLWHLPEVAFGLIPSSTQIQYAVMLRTVNIPLELFSVVQGVQHDLLASETKFEINVPDL